MKPWERRDDPNNGNTASKLLLFCAPSVDTAMSSMQNT